MLQMRNVILNNEPQRKRLPLKHPRMPQSPHLHPSHRMRQMLIQRKEQSSHLFPRPPLIPLHPHPPLLLIPRQHQRRRKLQPHNPLLVVHRRIAKMPHHLLRTPLPRSRRPRSIDRSKSNLRPHKHRTQPRGKNSRIQRSNITRSRISWHPSTIAAPSRLSHAATSVRI